MNFANKLMQLIATYMLCLVNGMNTMHLISFLFLFFFCRSLANNELMWISGPRGNQQLTLLKQLWAAAYESRLCVNLFACVRTVLLRMLRCCLFLALPWVDHCKLSLQLLASLSVIVYIYVDDLPHSAGPDPPTHMASVKSKDTSNSVRLDFVLSGVCFLVFFFPKG